MEATMLMFYEALLSRDESGADDFRIQSDVNPNFPDMEKSFYIHADMDNLKLIVSGCSVGYGISKIQQI
jgi:hypothetical protein